MLRCSSCGHCSQVHTHYRRGSDCSACDCVRFAHPLLGWLWHLNDRVAAAWERRGRAR